MAIGEKSKRNIKKIVRQDGIGKPDILMAKKVNRPAGFVDRPK